MAIYPESGSYTVFGEESVYGTPPASVNSHFGLIQEVTPKISNNYKEYRGVGAGVGPARVDVAGLLNTGIPLTFNVFNGTFLKYALGSVSGSGTVGVPFSYTEANSLPSLTIEDAFNLDTDQVLRFLGSIVSKCTITGRLGEPLSVNLDILSRDVTKNNTYQSITVPTTGLYLFTHGTYEVPTSTAITEVQEFNITIDNKGRLTG
ncbi:MAG: phage tail tube protein, partial [Candidatus Nanoarchaeia archaeon]